MNPGMDIVYRFVNQNILPKKDVHSSIGVETGWQGLGFASVCQGDMDLDGGPAARDTGNLEYTLHLFDPFPHGTQA
jgi:hypothetical protein